MASDGRTDIDLDSKQALILTIIASAILIITANQAVLMDCQESGDEYAYIISAKLFSMGKLSVPSPPHSMFFNYWHVINDGKYYGKYPPGWPFFLSLGMIAGIPMASNLAFGLLTLVVVYLMGEEFFSRGTGITAAVLMGISPYFIFNSASYFSHTSMLFFITLFTYVYLRNAESEKTVNYFVLGTALGTAFNIRPLDAVVIGACFFAHHALTVWLRFREGSLRSERLVNGGFVFVFGLGIFIAIFLLYNHVQTGNAFLMPFQKYSPKDSISFGLESGKLQTMESITTSLLKKLVVWVPYSPLIFIALACTKGRQRNTALLLFSTIIATLAAYSLYWADGLNQYGPRYLYSTASSIFLLTGAAFIKIKEKSNGAYYAFMAVALVYSIGLLVYTSPLYHEKLVSKKAMYDAVNERNISNAIVFHDWNHNFIPMPASDYIKNDLNFNEPVIYVMDLGDKNRLLMKDYPSRSYYTWKCRLSYGMIGWLDFEARKITKCTLDAVKTSG